MGKAGPELSQALQRMIGQEVDKLLQCTRAEESKKYFQHGTTSVYDHSLSVVYKSCELARRWGLAVDYRAMIRGAFLHDYFLYDWHDRKHRHRRPHGFYHPGVALYNALKDVELSDKEQNIIRRHMFPLTPVPPNCLEAWVVCIADKICSSKETLAGRKDRQKGNFFSAGKGKSSREQIISIEKRKYSYHDMKRDLKKLAQKYPDYMTVYSFGKSADGRELYAVCLGDRKAKKQGVIQASMHGREWQNTKLFMALLEDCCRNYLTGSYRKIPLEKLFGEVGIWIVPMLNPDGVSISQFGFGAIRTPKLREFVRQKKGGKYWKANARGVDLNRNYSPGFAGEVPEEGSKPGAMAYPGPAAASEPETEAFLKLLLRTKPEAVINYHQAGEVIYYREAKALAREIQGMTGYAAQQEQGEANGNLGDWLSVQGIGWCTVETGAGNAPVDHRQFEDILRRNRGIIPLLAWRIQQGTRYLPL